MYSFPTSSWGSIAICCLDTTTVRQSVELRNRLNTSDCLMPLTDTPLTCGHTCTRHDTQCYTH